jgi:abortive infection bacteriophage resistance protein
VVADEPSALDWLRRLGYYRLSAYWYPFRERVLVQVGPDRIENQVQDAFQEGATFEQAVALYQFDKRLRLLVMDAIEQIEVAARVDIAHFLGAVDTFAQENAALLDGNFTRPGRGGGPSDHEKWMAKLTESTDRSREEFVSHYKTKYGVPLPIWVSIEVWDFGLLSRFYAGMQFKQREAMANRFGVGRSYLMASWLRTLNYLRNISAHHCRLWNRNIVDQPKMPRAGEIPAFDPLLAEMSVERVYPALCVIAHLLRHSYPESDWPHRLVAHLLGFPVVDRPQIDLEAMGCPDNWQRHSFWAVRAL